MKTRNLIKSKLSIIACVLILIVSTMTLSTTMSLLFDISDPVVNTFTYGDINITLNETDTKIDDDDNNRTNTYKMIPGEEITKDPLVTVKKGSEDCYVFVELKEINDFNKFMEYRVLDGLNGMWSPLIENPGIYYIEINSEDVKDEDLMLEVLENNKVIVKDTVTKEELNSLTEETYPKLEIIAYAVQKSEENEAINTAYKAWALVNNRSQN